MALKDITTIEETEQLSADATFYTEDGGAFRRSGVDAVKDALGLALESTATKQALLNCFQHVAWIDENGQDYYDALYDALYNIPLFITATFVQGSNTIYNTDPLSVLRQYLVVRATYEDETVQTVTAYTLSGNLTVGTSTITVSYKGRSATFEVTVTQAESRITAVYTQSGTVTEFDDINTLKADLVVTYYATPSASGVVLSDTDYTLSGTLETGTSTILVDYDGNTATFSVTVSAYEFAPTFVTGGPSATSTSIAYGYALNRACNNPMAFVLPPGVYEVDNTVAGSDYYYAVSAYSYDDATYDVDWSFTEGTAKTFVESSSVPYTIIWSLFMDGSSGWQNTSKQIRVSDTTTVVAINVKKYSAGTENISVSDLSALNNGGIIFRRVSA